MAKLRFGVCGAVASLVAAAAVFGASNASAATYNVLFDVLSDVVQGTITTDGTIGGLRNTNISSYTLTMSGPGITTSTVTGGSANVTTGFPFTLSASSTAIGYINANTQTNITSTGGGSQRVFFSNISTILLEDSAGHTAVSGTLTQPFAIATIATSNVPLPAALPLFATGLAGLGVLGWRKKRKDIAA